MLSQQKNLHSVNDEYNYFECGEPYITLSKPQTVLLSVLDLVLIILPDDDNLKSANKLYEFIRQ